MFLKQVVIVVCLCILNSQVGESLIRFFKNSNYTDLYHESDYIHNVCNQVPIPFTPYQIPIPYVALGSIVTDTCVILYHGRFGINCKTIEAQQVMPGNTTTLWEHTTGYRRCDENVGGLQLNIDMVKPIQNYEGYLLHTFELVVTYDDVCNCVNIPETLEQTHFWSIYNNHNDYIAYFERDCAQVGFQSLLVSGGLTWFSKYVPVKRTQILYTPFVVKSVGPNEGSVYFKHGCNIKEKILNLQKKSIELQEKFVELMANYTDSLRRIVALENKFKD